MYWRFELTGRVEEAILGRIGFRQRRAGKLYVVHELLGLLFRRRSRRQPTNASTAFRRAQDDG
jgi:hypothetical protein